MVHGGYYTLLTPGYVDIMVIQEISLDGLEAPFPTVLCRMDSYSTDLVQGTKIQEDKCFHFVFSLSMHFVKPSPLTKSDV